MNTWQGLKLRGRFNWWAPARNGRHPSFYDSHSQYGEDMAIRAIVGDRLVGTYIDVGAHHPVYFSNTYHFYRKGWRGLNIDAMPGSMEPFQVLRPHDINVEACLAPNPGQELTFYSFRDSAFNTTDPDVAAQREREGGQLLTTRRVNCQTLAECLERYLPGRPIDLLTIDIEGLDEAILRSLDWSTLRPLVVVFERHDLSMDNLADDSLIAFLKGHGYRLQSKCGPSFVMLSTNVSGV